MSRPTVKIDPECGRRLAGLMAAYGITQSQLAEKIDREISHISNIFRGKRRLTPALAQSIVDKMFPDVLVDYLLNKSDFQTIAEKEQYFREAALHHDEAFECFIEGIEDFHGCRLHSQETDLLIGDYIAVINQTGGKVGAISAESFRNLQSEVENYASYLIQRIIKTEMLPMPGEEEGEIKNG